MKTKAAQHCTAQQVCEDLLSLLSKYKANMYKLAEEHGLTVMQLHALRTISDGNNTMGSIAQTMHCDASNVTGIIDRLLALKLVTRQESSQDRRVKTVELTSDGTALLNGIVKDMPERLGCTRLAQNELDAVHNAIDKLATL